MAVLAWLLDSDPAIRWQVLRDLVCAPPEVVAAERARLGACFDQDVDGVVARLLGEQLEDGGWNCEAENPPACAHTAGARCRDSSTAPSGNQIE